MKKFNRELLVLLKEETNPKNIEHEVEQLHELLFDVERTESLIIAHEVVNINKRRITSANKRLKAILRLKELKPFVFLYNLN